MNDAINRKIFAVNLKRFMDEKGVTPKELSQALRFPYTTVLSWLKGDNYPRIDKIEKLADYFDVYKSDLIEDKRGQDLVDPETAAKNARIAALTQRMRTSETLVEVVNLLSAMDDSTLDSIRDYVSFLKNKK